MNGVPVLVREDLQLNVPRACHVFLKQDATITERGFRFALSCFQGGTEIGVALNAPHAFAATASHCLNQHRVADLVGFLFEEFWLLQLAVITGHYWHSGLLHERLRSIFEPHGTDRLGWRTDKNDTRIKTGLCKICILRKKAITWMNAFRARRLGRCDQLIYREITLRRRGSANSMRLIAEAYMQGAGIRFRIDRDGAQAQLPRGASNATGNLAAIGD